MPLTFAHFLGIGFFVVIVAAEVKEAVDYVERQFGLNIVAQSDWLGWGKFNADDQLPREFLRSRVAERKTQNVRRFIVIEIALVEPVNGGIVYERQADFVVVLFLALEDRS